MPYLQDSFISINKIHAILGYHIQHLENSFNVNKISGKIKNVVNKISINFISF